MLGASGIVKLWWLKAENVKEENQEMAAYVKWMDRHPFFLLLQASSCGSEPTKADYGVSFGTPRSGMSFSTFSKTVPTTAIFTIPLKSNIPWYVEGY